MYMKSEELMKQLLEESRLCQRLKTVEIIKRYFEGEDKYQPLCEQLCNWVLNDGMPLEG